MLKCELIIQLFPLFTKSLPFSQAAAWDRLLTRPDEEGLACQILGAEADSAEVRHRRESSNTPSRCPAEQLCLNETLTHATTTKYITVGLL